MVSTPLAKKSHNPYFNRWFSAIVILLKLLSMRVSHNPYFNRWFSAIKEVIEASERYAMSQSLF